VAGLEVGQILVLTDFAYSKYQVVLDGDTGGYYLPYKSGFKFKLLNNDQLEFPFINVKSFGSKMDGSDDTQGFAAALEKAKSGGTVLIPQGVLNIDPTTLPSELKGLYCIGTIKGNGSSGTDGVLQGDGLINCKLRLNMDMSNGDRAGIKLTNSVDNQFIGGKIYGFTDHPTLNHYGIWLYHGCSRNKIMIDTIIGFNEPTQRGLLINITADALPYGDYFNGGVTARPTSGLCNENQVIGGEFIAGSYAVNIQGGGYNKVLGAVCRQQDHRTFYLSNTAYGNTISNNHCLEFASSAVVFGYGAEDNEFSHNYCFAVSVGGEAVVNINTGAKRNRVLNNYLNARNVNFGVYMGCDAIDNEIVNNRIYNYFVAGIAIDSDWVDPASKPANSFYIRPNYDSPPVGDRWAFNDSSGNILENNKLYNADPTRNVAAIALSQIDGLAGAVVRDTILDSNKTLSPTGLAYNLSLYQESAGGILRTTLINNVFNSALSFLSADPSTTSATWNDKIEHFADNKKLDELLVAEPIALSAGTPSVANNSSVPTERLFALDASATVTNFTGGYTGQEILVRLAAGATITYGSGTIRTQGLTDITGRSSNDFVKFKLLNGVWFEIFRSW
jgi:hypothetical protein